MRNRPIEKEKAGTLGGSIGRALILTFAMALMGTALLGPSDAAAALPGFSDIQRLATRTVFIVERNPALGVAAIAVVYFLLRLLPKRGI